jgi:hypothetical protein
MLAAQLVGWDSAQEIEVLGEPVRPYHFVHDESRKEMSLKVVVNRACYLLHPVVLLGLFFDPEFGYHMLVRNVGWLSSDYIALHARIQNS